MTLKRQDIILEDKMQIKFFLIKYSRTKQNSLIKVIWLGKELLIILQQVNKIKP